ncbi:hypothetical protein VNPA120661_41150 [Pseudomonas aeruginosa]|uniref:hypothetical protein n=1 Tax=Pseudomonas aeruginosa TaxID=287 RepID=UPI0021E1B61A|nr:hypothetical protein [Pseudomonas aeruginosa]GLE83796.1 hypothetical protein VNPA120661_41150 [Pseudomonas aeruginosa]
MSNELTDVRCPCGAEFQADSYDAGFIAGSGMCQNCDAALPPKDICTCPSGDGSLRWPCPKHPAVEQAGGDERAAFELFVRKHCGMPEHIAVNWGAKFTNDAWEGWQARAALAQPSPAQADEKPGDSILCYGCFAKGVGPDHFDEAGKCLARQQTEPLGAEFAQVLSDNLPELLSTGQAEQAEAERLREAYEWGYGDGQNNPNGYSDKKERDACVNELLKQPSPAQAEQHWPKLEKPAQVGAVRFSAGVSSRLVVEAAQRLYEFESTPEKEAERPEVVAWRYGFSGGIVSDKACLDEWKSGGEYQSLMTVAQHERIVGALRARNEKLEADAGALEWLRSTFKVHKAIVEQAGCGTIEQLAEQRDAANSRLHEVSVACATAEQERDAALAEVERLRESKGDPSGSFDRCMKMMYERDENAKRLDAALARVAELDKQCRDDVARALGLRPSQERGFAWSYLLASIKSCVKASEDAAQAQHSVPDGYRLIRLEHFAAIKAQLNPEQVDAYRGRNIYDEDKVYANWNACRSALDEIKDVFQQIDWDAENELAELLAAAPGNSAQHSVPEGWMLVECGIWTQEQVDEMQKTVARFRNSEFVDDRALAMAVADAGQCKAPEISLAELLAAATGKEGL